MAFPQVAAVNGGNNSVDSFNHTVNLPADISAGDLLLVFFACDADPVVTFPEGWTQLFDTSHAGAITLSVYYRVADGEEGASIPVTTNEEQKSVHTSYRITGYSGTPEAGTPVLYTTNQPNPLNFAPTWGAEDTLWFAVEANDGNWVVTVWPDYFTDGRCDTADVAGGCSVGTCRRELNDIDCNPSSFTISGSDQTVCNTIGVKPAEAPPPAAKAYGLVV